MTVELPHFSYREIERFTACCFIPQLSASERFWPPEGKDPECQEARAESETGTVYLRLIVNRQADPDGLHVHFDIARAERFKNDPPKPNSTPDDIVERLSQFEGDRINILGRGGFVVPLNKLPEGCAVGFLLGISAGPEASELRSGLTHRILLQNPAIFVGVCRKVI